MNYTDIIKGLLDHRYPSYQDTSSIFITNIVIRILPLTSRPYFMRYQQLQTLTINRCDLRNLQNFPKILSLKYLDISDNSLQGTLNYLMPLSELTYLNISNNLIRDSRNLLPLQANQGLQIYFAGNPFTQDESCKQKLKNWGLKVAKQPIRLQYVFMKLKQQEKEQKQQIKKDQKLQYESMEQTHRPIFSKQQAIQESIYSLQQNALIKQNEEIDSQEQSEQFWEQENQLIEQQQSNSHALSASQSDQLSLRVPVLQTYEQQEDMLNLFNDSDD